MRHEERDPDLGDRYWPSFEDARQPDRDDWVSCACGDPLCPGLPEHTRPMGDGKGGPCLFCGRRECVGDDGCVYIPPEEERTD